MRPIVQQRPWTAPRLKAIGRTVPEIRLAAPQNGGKIPASEKIISFNINALTKMRNTSYPPPRIFHHTDPAALMGPDDHRHSGERAAYGSFGFGYLRRAEFP